MYGKKKHTAIYSIFEPELDKDGEPVNAKATMSKRAIADHNVDAASLIGPRCDLFVDNLARMNGGKYRFRVPGDFKRDDPFCFKYEHTKYLIDQVRCWVNAPAERPGNPVTYNYMGVPPNRRCQAIPFIEGILFKNKESAMFVKYCNVDGGLRIDPGLPNEGKFTMTLFMNEQQSWTIGFIGIMQQYHAFRDYMVTKLKPPKANVEEVIPPVVKEKKKTIVLKDNNDNGAGQSDEQAAASNGKSTQARRPIVCTDSATASSSKRSPEPTLPTTYEGIATRLTRKRQGKDLTLHDSNRERPQPPTVNQHDESVETPNVSSDRNVGDEEEMEHEGGDVQHEGENVEAMETDDAGNVTHDDDGGEMVVDANEPMQLEEINVANAEGNVDDDAENNVEDDVDDLLDAVSKYKMKNSMAKIAAVKADGFMDNDTSQLNLAESQDAMQEMIDVLNDMKFIDIKNAPPKKLKKKKGPLHQAVMRDRNEQHMVPLVEGWGNYRGPYRKLSDERKARIRAVMADDVYRGCNLSHDSPIVMDSIITFLNTRKQSGARKAVKTKQVKKSRTKLATTLR